MLTEAFSWWLISNLNQISLTSFSSLYWHLLINIPLPLMFESSWFLVWGVVFIWNPDTLGIILTDSRSLFSYRFCWLPLTALLQGRVPPGYSEVWVKVQVLYLLSWPWWGRQFFVITSGGVRSSRSPGLRTNTIRPSLTPGQWGCYYHWWEWKSPHLRKSLPTLP